MKELAIQIIARCVVAAVGVLLAWGIALLVGWQLPTLESHVFALLATVWLFMSWINARRYFELRRDL
jgi:hypothetical protein